ncbi:HSF-type DNA-binding-domain-containing protein [Mycena metata]|uniref:HSF-type DNA-binding-domain-containing protein n=1 Tax=Mycena metata TaxID=1033252 RepID=A0AAD7K398_9AGAR|nr:HSF-type DNA-binding-domain-containing protein [Mycena metata]
MDYQMQDTYNNRQWQQQPQQQQQQQTHYPPFAFNHQHTPVHRSSSSLSLNLSSLTVASPTNLSPIGPGPASGALPATPISPATYGNHLHAGAFQFGAGDEHDNSNYDSVSVAVPHSPRSTTSTLPRKRSFSSDPPLTSNSRAHTPSVSVVGPPSLRITTDNGTLSPRPASPVSANPTSAGYDDMDMGLATYSPVDGSSGSGDDGGHPHSHAGKSSMVPPTSSNILSAGKPMATNNFVTKLYQMITDAKSSHFIAWTEMGTSFVVSNVGEFSRSILGSHFKHNNFSSFVRQLNMYGFHKINRTPRAQRTTSDAQTWEFSHHKFLRGRPDLLDEIKRKALEPDPAMKHRVELPGEVAAQLSTMRDENQRMYEQLAAERRRVDKLVSVVSRLWDVVGKGFPGNSECSFPPLIFFFAFEVLVFRLVRAFYSASDSCARPVSLWRRTRLAFSPAATVRARLLPPSLLPSFPPSLLPSLSVFLIPFLVSIDVRCDAMLRTRIPPRTSGTETSVALSS